MYRFFRRKAQKLKEARRKALAFYFIFEDGFDSIVPLENEVEKVHSIPDL